MKTENSNAALETLTDIAKKRLQVTISGNIETKSLSKLYTDIRFCACDPRHGINVISDNYLYIKLLSFKPIFEQEIEEAEEMFNNSKRRSGIRFQLYVPVTGYTVSNEYGNGFIINISTSGCAIESPYLPLPPNARILITLNFDEHDTLSSKFSIKANVVRTNDDFFAAQFLDLDDDRKELLYHRFIYETGLPL